MPIDLAPSLVRGRFGSHRPPGVIRRELATTTAEMVDVAHQLNHLLDGNHDLSRTTTSTPLTDLEALVVAMTDHLLDAVEGGPDASSSLTIPATHATYHLLLDVERLRRRLHDLERESQLQRLTAIQAHADAAPAAYTDFTRLLAEVASEVSRLCGLERVMVLRRESCNLQVVSTFVRGNGELAQQYQRQAGSLPIELAPHRIETHIVRSGRSALVRRPLEDPNSFRPIVSMLNTTGYAAAPVAAFGQVVATIHGDYGVSGRTLDESDRDLLAAFAASIGNAAERLLLIEQIESLRGSLRSALHQAEGVNGALRAARRGHSVSPTHPGSPSPEALGRDRPVVAPTRGTRPQTAQSPTVAALTTMEGLAQLTKREMQVLQLITTGASNADIARQLVITEGTVKTHVKKVLRKTGAARRSQAAAIYTHLTRHSTL
ncbi:LuxR C-terminal-related transcriptional regulator [Rhodococcus qingshengii]|uniref:LuxR C-terminal-related transcriptional regulator n=1 Tax=Rhodococcus qingshengii TaxID=334542 RepID=UPI00237CA3AD|nr:LuxR C-terminal-related transcriptional regulator [Rhodococcus qingshengii]WCT06027.1 LuxR C-terminal-related transcriptional regulator [Rhodococcus qingshengii]